MNKCNVAHQYSHRRLLALMAGVTIIVILLLHCGQHLGQLVPQTAIKDRETMISGPSDEKIKRLKRFIIFNGNGVVKFVLGGSFPVILPDKKRSLGAYLNFQMQYTPAPRPLYWWSFYNTTTFAARRERSLNTLKRWDNSRSAIYEFIEGMMRRHGQFDSECLLKAICEIARAPLTEVVTGTQEAGDDDGDGHEYSIEDDYGQNIYHALINAIFTPHLPNVERRYWDARVAGSKGANCDELFAQCSAMNDWLKRFTRFM